MSTFSECPFIDVFLVRGFGFIIRDIITLCGHILSYKYNLVIARIKIVIL